MSPSTFSSTNFQYAANVNNSVVQVNLTAIAQVPIGLVTLFFNGTPQNLTKPSNIINLSLVPGAGPNYMTIRVTDIWNLQNAPNNYIVN